MNWKLETAEKNNKIIFNREAPREGQGREWEDRGKLGREGMGKQVRGREGKGKLVRGREGKGKHEREREAWGWGLCFYCKCTANHDKLNPQNCTNRHISATHQHWNVCETFTLRNIIKMGIAPYSPG